MKYVKMLVLVFTFILLAACDRTGETNYEGEFLGMMPIGDESFEFVENILISAVEDGIISELEDVDPILHITRSVLGDIFGDGVWQLVLIDLTSGEIVATYDFDGPNIPLKIWVLGDGYYAVGIENWQNLESKVIIFDESLTPMEILPYDDENFPFLLASALRLIEGELFVYGLGGNENWETASTTDFLRVNLHTSEIEILFELEDSLFFYEFTGEDQVFLADISVDFEAGKVHRDYGILDLKSGEIDLFESDNFEYENIDFNGSHILLSEARTMGEMRNEVVVFDAETMSTHFVQLGAEESIWARLSFDGQHIVTISERESIFRKYDLNGVVVSEVVIEIPLLVADPNNHLFIGSFEIFPITDRVYAIHSLGFPVERHIQFIIVP